MDILDDRVINVPIGDDDLLKTARSLSDSDDNGLVCAYKSQKKNGLKVML